MLKIEDVLSISSVDEFERTAMELFIYQAERCEPYREYLSLIGVNPRKVSSTTEIPFLPIELFKSHRVYCGNSEPEIVFTSSTTGGGQPSRHFMEHSSDYEKTFTKAFRLFYGPAENISIYALLPGYLERQGSSLVYMADHLIRTGGGGFYLDRYEKLYEDMERNTRPKILLGVSFALVDLALKNPRRLSDTIIMETGGMKGRGPEMPKTEFHGVLKEAFGVENIHSEYGMAELSSQAYSSGNGVFKTPPWMRAVIRDPNDLFSTVAAGSSGGINMIDLANLSSCAFIQTQDLGTVYPDGGFMIHGRADRSEIRGCNLLVQ